MLKGGIDYVRPTTLHTCSFRICEIQSHVEPLKSAFFLFFFYSGFYLNILCVLTFYVVIGFSFLLLSFCIQIRPVVFLLTNKVIILLWGKKKLP